jgi:hypothetical protein
MILHTDQVDCFNESGQRVACAGTGHDGQRYTAALNPVDRFQAIEDVVRDHLTGLTWAKDAALSKFPLTFAEATRFVENMNSARKTGGNTWVLPTRRQLFSLISHQRINPSLPRGHCFENVFNGYYWTATTCARLPDQAWYVHLGGGRVYHGMKHGSYMVWPVATRTVRKNAIVERGIGTGGSVWDRTTGRTWMIPVTDDGHPVSWSGALAAIERLNRRGAMGFEDWRLPNIRELESLCDLNRHSPALAIGGHSASLQEGYWSATTSLYEPRYAWVLYTRDGAVGVGYKAKADFHVMAVRSG